MHIIIQGNRAYQGKGICRRQYTILGLKTNQKLIIKKKDS